MLTTTRSAAVARCRRVGAVSAGSSQSLTRCQPPGHLEQPDEGGAHGQHADAGRPSPTALVRPSWRSRPRAPAPRRPGSRGGTCRRPSARRAIDADDAAERRRARPASIAVDRISSLLKKPEKGGMPAIARQPDQHARLVSGRCRRRPPIRSRLCSPARAWMTMPTAEEEQRLEEGVRQEVEHRGAVGAEPRGHDHVADLAHRAPGEDALDVLLHAGRSWPPSGASPRRRSPPGRTRRARARRARWRRTIM